MSSEALQMGSKHQRGRETREPRSIVNFDRIVEGAAGVPKWWAPSRCGLIAVSTGRGGEGHRGDCWADLTIILSSSEEFEFSLIAKQLQRIHLLTEQLLRLYLD
jgi:hypothetical protein